jgi:hypothetical protein
VIQNEWDICALAAARKSDVSDQYFWKFRKGEEKKGGSKKFEFPTQIKFSGL